MKDIYRYGSEVNSHDLLKILAITTMVIDHIGKFFLANNVWFRIIGRMAAPQFFFLVGYSGSYRFKKSILSYGIGLLVVNYLVNPSATLAEHIIPINILISFVIIKALLHKYDVAKLPTESLLIVLAVLLLFSLPSYILIEYGTLGLCYAIGARLHKQRHHLRRFWIVLTVLVHFFFALVFTLIIDPDVPMNMLPFTIPLLAVIFAANLTIFLNYSFRVFNVKGELLRTLAVYISRYSLELYFFHLSVFMVISYIWNPAV